MIILVHISSYAIVAREILGMPLGAFLDVLVHHYKMLAMSYVGGILGGHPQRGRGHSQKIYPP